MRECGVCGAKMTITGGSPVHLLKSPHRHRLRERPGVSRQLTEALILKPVTDKLLKPEAVKHAVVPTEAEGERFLTAHLPGMSAEDVSDVTIVAGAGVGQYMPRVKVRVAA